MRQALEEKMRLKFGPSNLGSNLKRSFRKIQKIDDEETDKLISIIRIVLEPDPKQRDSVKVYYLQDKRNLRSF